MGVHVIKMPDLGEGIAEVEVVEWRVKPGDSVVEDQVLADVMTDKATVEIPSPVHGTVLTLGGEVGESLAVGADLIRIEVEGAGNEKAPRTAPEAATATPAAPPRRPGEAEPVTVSEPERVVTTVTPPEAPRTPADSPRVHAEEKAASLIGHVAHQRGQASPAVRQRARQLGVALESVHGTGPVGRITHADLDKHLMAHQPSSAPARPAPLRVDAMRHGEQTVKVMGLRRKIAEKMQEAKRRIPHFTYVEEIDVTELEALRTQLNTRYGKERGKLTLLPLFMRALVLAAREYPQVNARFDDDAGVVTVYEAMHIGIATQTDTGLMVPVVRNAEARDLWSSAAEVARLANAARSGKAVRDELSGSTITITSLGALGGIVTTPVINRPEVGIVGINKIVDRPMIRDGAMVARKMMNLSSSFDHRVIDGMYAAQFVQAIRAYLENPATLFIE